MAEIAVHIVLEICNDTADAVPMCVTLYISYSTYNFSLFIESVYRISGMRGQCGLRERRQIPIKHRWKLFPCCNQSAPRNILSAGMEAK